MEKKEKQSPDDDSRPDHLLTSLSEDFIAEILSLTSPWEASRFAVISKGFKSASESDIVWDRFLPSDYQDILPRSVSTVVYASKKQLYFVLSDSPILLDDGNLSFSLDRRSGKKCFMVRARNLTISGIDSPDWEYTTHSDSRFSEVAQLRLACRLDIRSRINSRMLSSKTTYGAYLVFKTALRLYGLEYVNTIVRVVNDETDLDAEERASTVHLHQAQAVYRSASPWQPGRFPLSRGDGWMEMEIGDFYNDGGIHGEVEARMMEIRRLNTKSGLIVEGMEFRPKKRFI